MITTAKVSQVPSSWATEGKVPVVMDLFLKNDGKYDDNFANAEVSVNILPNITYTPKKDDMVLVAFIENNPENSVILGYLYNDGDFSETNEKPKPHINANSINVLSMANFNGETNLNATTNFPLDTDADIVLKFSDSIKVTKEQLKYLDKLEQNVQEELFRLEEDKHDLSAFNDFYDNEFSSVKNKVSELDLAINDPINGIKAKIESLQSALSSYIADQSQSSALSEIWNSDINIARKLVIQEALKSVGKLSDSDLKNKYTKANNLSNFPLMFGDMSMLLLVAIAVDSEPEEG